MKLMTKFVATTVLVAGFNSAFAEGQKEAVLDMGKGGFTLTISVPADTEGPYDFGKNPGVGKAMDGQFQYQEVMFRGKIDDSSVGFYKATSQKISPSKTGEKLTPENMAKDQIISHGFKDKTVQINCPPSKIEGANSVCYTMSGEPTFDGKSRKNRAAGVIIAVSWASNTQGYTLMSMVSEKEIEKFESNKVEIEKYARTLLSYLFKYHKVIKN